MPSAIRYATKGSSPIRWIHAKKSRMHKKADKKLAITPTAIVSHATGAGISVKSLTFKVAAPSIWTESRMRFGSYSSRQSEPQARYQSDARSGCPRNQCQSLCTADQYRLSETNTTKPERPRW